jgi:membrane associated rhomboid family serine protease
VSYYRQPPFRGPGVALGFPPLTPVNRLLLMGFVAIWALQFLEMLILRSGWMIHLFAVTPAAVLRGWIWQPFTYQFLHAVPHPFHLLINMLMLYMLGGDLERHWGPRRYLTYVLVCGTGAGAVITTSGLLFGDPRIPTLGASGAIYGLLLAYGTIFAERTLLFMLIFPMKARTLCWILFAMTFVLTVGYTGDNVSHVGHLGGMVVGWLYLKRAWRVGEFVRELKWKIRRRRFKVMPPRDRDPWLH